MEEVNNNVPDELQSMQEHTSFFKKHLVKIIILLSVIFLIAIMTIIIFYTGKKSNGGWEIEDGQVYYYETINNCSVSMQCDSELKKTLLENADAGSFKILNDIYAKDKNNVYIGKDKIDNVDINTFEVIEENYAKDKNRVYMAKALLTGNMSANMAPGIIEGADPNTFEVLHFNYSKDKNNVYVFDRVVEGADIETFVSYDGPARKDPEIKEGEGRYNAEDKNYKYFHGNRVGVAKSTENDQKSNYDTDNFGDGLSTEKKDIYKDWKTYKNAEFDIEFKYPSDGTYTIEQPSNNNIIISQEHPGNRFHISKSSIINIRAAEQKIINNINYEKFYREGMESPYGYIINQNNTYYTFESTIGPSNKVFENLMQSVLFITNNSSLDILNSFLKNQGLNSENYKIFNEIKSSDSRRKAILFGLDTEKTQECCSKPFGLIVIKQNTIEDKYKMLEGALIHMYLENVKWENNNLLSYNFVIEDEGGKNSNKEYLNFE